MAAAAGERGRRAEEVREKVSDSEGTDGQAESRTKRRAEQVQELEVEFDTGGERP